MRFKRGYEKKIALVNKWFTNEEIKEYQELAKKPTLVRVHDYSSSNLFTVVSSCLPEIADEKECMMEAITEAMPYIDNEALMILLDNLYENLNSNLTNDGHIEEINLCPEKVNEILSATYTTFRIVKLLTEIISSNDRIKFFESRIEMAKAGVAE